MVNIADYDSVGGGGGKLSCDFVWLFSSPRGIGNIFVTEKLSCD